MNAVRENAGQGTPDDAQLRAPLINLREANASLKHSAGPGLSARGSEWVLLTRSCGGKRALLVGITDMVALYYLARLHEEISVWHDESFDEQDWRCQSEVLGLDVKVAKVAAADLTQRLAAAAVGFDLIVVGDAVGRLVCRNSQDAATLVNAVNNALEPNGQSFVISTIAPSIFGVRRHRAHSERPTLAQLRKALAPMAVSRSYYFYREQRCPEEILGFDGVLPAGRDSLLTNTMGRLGLIMPLHNSVAVTGGDAAASCWLRTIAGTAVEAAGFDSKPVIRRCLPRDNGTVTAMLEDTAGYRTVLRVPLSTAADRRLQHAWRCVSEMRGTLEWLQPLTPEPLIRGVCGIWPYYLERQCKGIASGSLRGRRALDRLHQSVDALLVKFAVTGEKAEPLTESAFDEHCGRYFKLAAEFAPPAAGELNELGQKLAAAMVGRDVPLVRVHGDFNPGNVLCDSEGTITGVIDWDACQNRGLPLQDPLHFVLHATRKQHSLQLGEAIVGAVAGDPFNAGQRALLHRYCDALGIDPELKTPLFIMYWLRHVCLHIEYRSGPLAETWLDNNLHRPLQQLVKHYAS